MKDTAKVSDGGEATGRLRRQTQALLELAQNPAVLNGDIDTVFALVTRLAAEVLGVRYTNVLRIEEGGSGISSLIRYDHGNACALDSVRIDGETLPRYFQAIRSGGVIDATDAWEDLRVNEFRGIYLEPMGIVSVLDAGFRIGREFNGVICIASTERREWQEDEIRFVLTLAAHLSLALSNHELQRLAAETAGLERLTCQDSLTGIANRRGFDRSFQQYWNLSVRNGSPLALLLIDLDHFKRINDNYGHLAGDRCLRQVAGILRDILRRQSDVAARIGGEEFAILLPDTDRDGAFALGQRLLMNMRNTTLELDEARETVMTFSIGLACRDSTRHAEPALLFESADEALYLAKAQGRNRMIEADDVPESFERKHITRH